MSHVAHLKTSSGRVAVRMSPGTRSPILLIHGNSMSARAFDGLLESPLGRSYQLIAVDLPGHGLSDDATSPDTAYTIPAFADAMLDVLFALNIPQAIVCGWSLGGHIALEMMARSSAVSGCFVTGAPPVTPGPQAASGFNLCDELFLFMTETLDTAGKRALAELSTGAARAQEFAYNDVDRADGRVRGIAGKALLSGVGADPRPLFDDPSRPVALVVGEHEIFVSPDFMRSISGPGLWRNAVQTIAGAGHAPFLDAPGEYAALLLQFIRDVSRLRRKVPTNTPSPRKRRIA